MADNKNAEGGKPMPKSAVFQQLADSTGLSKKDVASVFDALAAMIRQQLGKKGPGVFAVPGLVKLKLVRKPATKAGTRPNPFKPGEMMQVKARPASTKVKPVALKGLKDMVK